MKVISRDLIKNCTHKVRIRYTFDNLVNKSFLKGFRSEYVRLNNFSQIVKGAKDHFYVDKPEEFRISGVLDSNEIIITYLKSQGSSLDQSIVNLENIILNH